MNQLPGIKATRFQEQILDVAFELLPNGLPAYRYITITVPRQQGKTLLLLAIELYRCLLWERLPQRVVYSAQTGWAGHTKLIRDQVPLLKRSPMDSEVKRYRYAAGDDGIEFNNGSWITIQASGASAGHGPTNDTGIIDEAFDDVDDTREGAMGPSMVTRPDAQLWIVSTAGDQTSAYLWRKVQEGRAAVGEGVVEGTCYFEWSAPDDQPIDAISTWQGCMPALGVMHSDGTGISEDTIRSIFTSTPAGEFERAYLNRWTAGNERIISKELWDAICSADVEPKREKSVFGLDASPMGAWASIVAVDNEGRGELLDHAEGMNWVVERLVYLTKTYGGKVVLDSTSPASALIPELISQSVGIVEYGTQEMATATQLLFNAIADGPSKIRFRRDQTELAMELAVQGARKRISRDLWFWGRSNSYVDTSPLVALTVAYRLASEKQRRRDPIVFFGR